MWTLDDSGESISVDSVHVPSATALPRKRTMSITAAKRKSIPTKEFALPSQKKYPLDTAARTRNAAARLEQNKGSISSAEYSEAKGRIASAAKKFGITSEYNAKKTRTGSGKGLHMKIGADGSMSIRHMTDKCVAFLPLQAIDESTFSEAVNMADTTPKLVWNKLAVNGTFLGHPAGPFKMDSSVFSQVVKNFNHDGVKIPFDYEHASEQKVEGNSAKGRGDAIASGWIHQLDARTDGLYGAVEWLPEARKKILAGEFKYISPAIRFGATDGVTGKDVGAKLSSAAIVLKPFLKNLPEIRASDAASSLQMADQSDGTKLVFLCSEISQDELVTMAASSGGYAMSSNQFLSSFRRMLNMDDMASPSDMADKVDRLQELCDMADGDPNAVVQGIDLSRYIPQLREFMRMPANTTLDDMLCAVSEMICSTIDSEGADMADIPSTDAPIVTATEPTSPAPVIVKETTNTMSDTTITLADHTVKLSEAVSNAVAQATAPLTLQLKDAEAKCAAALVTAADEAKKVVELSDQIKKRDEAVAADRVAEAFDTYKDTMKLSDNNKKQMALTLSADPVLFDSLYPKVTADKKHLLVKLSQDISTPTNIGKTVPDLKALLAAEQTKNPKASYDECFTMALKEQAKLMSV